jgi:DNA repair exonuclease SbcCD ATPase subunit
MKIYSLRTWNFKNLPTGGIFEFGNGKRTVFYGPNEAGKTSIFEAVTLVLTLPEISENRRLLNPVTKYGSPGRPKVELVFEHNGKKYRLFKDWELRRGELEIGGETLLTSPSRIKEELQRIIGILNTDSMRFLLLVGQDEVVPKEGEEKTRISKALLSSMERFLGAGTAIDPDEIEAGLSKIVGKRGDFVGENRTLFERLSNSLSRLKEEIDVEERRLERFAGHSSEVEELERKRSDLRANLSEKERLMDYLKHYVEYRRINESLSFFTLKFPRLKEIEERLKEKRDERKKYSHLEEKLKRIKTERERVRDLKKKLKRLFELKGKLEKIEEVLRGKKVPGEDELDQLRELLAREKTLIDSKKRQSLIFHLKALRDLSIIVGGSRYTLKEGEEREIQVESETGTFTIQLENLLTMKIYPGDLKEREEELLKLKERLGLLKGKFGTLDIKELTTRRRYHDKSKTLNEELDHLLDDKDYKDLKEELEELERGLEGLEKEIPEGVEGTKDRLKALDREIEKLEKEAESLKRELLLKCGGLDENTEKRLMEEVRKREEDVALQREKIDAKWREKLKSLPLEELEGFFKKLEKELESLREGLRKIELRIAELRGKLSEVPDWEELERKRVLREKYEEMMKLTTLHRKAIKILLEGIPKAREEAYEYLKREIMERMSYYFERITLGRYERVEISFDSERWKIVLHEREGGSYTVDDDFRLSQGTLQQLYLAIRLAFLDALSGTTLPLFLDDTLSDFDPERARETLKVLKRVSVERQVVLFTCHPEFKDFGYLVELGGNGQKDCLCDRTICSKS